MKLPDCWQGYQGSGSRNGLDRRAPARADVDVAQGEVDDYWRDYQWRHEEFQCRRWAAAQIARFGLVTSGVFILSAVQTFLFANAFFPTGGHVHPMRARTSGSHCQTSAVWANDLANGFDSLGHCAQQRDAVQLLHHERHAHRFAVIAVSRGIACAVGVSWPAVGTSLIRWT
jgi:hypothetical protein